MEIYSPVRSSAMKHVFVKLLVPFTDVVFLDIYCFSLAFLRCRHVVVFVSGRRSVEFHRLVDPDSRARHDFAFGRGYYPCSNLRPGLAEVLSCLGPEDVDDGMKQFL